MSYSAKKNIMSYSADEIMRFVEIAEIAEMEPLETKQSVSTLMHYCQNDCETCPIMALIDEQGDTCRMKQFDIASRLVDAMFQTKVVAKVSFYINIQKEANNTDVANGICDIITDNKSFYLADEEEFELLIDKKHPFTIEKLD